MSAPDPVEEVLPALVDLTYSATTDPSRYNELVQVWERYLERLAPEDVEDAERHHLRHFNRALEIFDKIGRQKHQSNREEAMVQLFTVPAYVIGRNGAVIQANTEGERLRLGTSTLTNGLDQAAFAIALKELQQGAPVALVPIYDSEGALADCAVLSQIEDGEESERFLLVSSGPQTSATQLQTLSDKFNLSASESEVLNALLQGESVADISERRGVGIATTRTQIRQLLEKTGSASLSDLIRQAGQISAQMSAVNIARTLNASGEGDPIHYERILTSDGRLLAFRQFGDPEGRPVLFIHNMMGGAIWPHSIEKLAAAKGWRIIAPSRPGFGLSDSTPAFDMELVRKTCSDMRALLDHLMIDRVLVIGNLSSAGLGIRFAKDHDDRVFALLTVGHAGLMDDEMIEAMSNPSRAMAKTYRKSPTALRFLIRVAVASVDVLGPNQMLRSNFRSSKPDSELLENTALVDALGEGLKHAIKQGGEAFSRDGFVALHDFRDDVAALNCPTICLLGREDTMYPVAQAERLLSDLPNYDLEVFENAGQFVFYHHAEQAFGLMDRLWQLGTMKKVGNS
ncbi:alpha/beta fold hydrolase [Planktotalea sp.]|uniref:alpha/beta fold hydrolase n=1 Tax=Planktotalea sp. TaxID=2029877 RepID=UPI00329A2753